MTDKIEWIRPSGNPLTSNNDPETIANLKALGYTIKKEAPTVKKAQPKQVNKAKQNPK